VRVSARMPDVLVAHRKAAPAEVQRGERRVDGQNFGNLCHPFIPYCIVAQVDILEQGALIHEIIT
jgi:hypothetical protein